MHHSARAGTVQAVRDAYKALTARGDWLKVADFMQADARPTSAGPAKAGPSAAPASQDNGAVN